MLGLQRYGVGIYGFRVYNIDIRNPCTGGAIWLIKNHLILALFSRRTFGDDTFAITVPNNNREQIRAEFLRLTESGGDDLVECLLELEGVINGTDWMNHIVRDVLIEMENFTESGERYCKIIKNCFLSNNPVMDDIFMTELGLSRTSYYGYKKESIMLFGLLLWHNAYTAVFEDGHTSYKEDGNGITPRV